MTAQEFDLTVDDGAVLHARVHPGTGTALVLLHDLDCDGSYWDEVVNRLRELVPDLHIVQVDLRGHGRSTLVDEPSRRRLVKDLKRICKGLGLTHPLVCGHGWGADVALASDIAAAVVAINPLMGRDSAPFEGDVQRPAHMRGARDLASLAKCRTGAMAAKPIRRGRRDAPLLLVFADPLDAVAVHGSEVLDAAAEVYAWQGASRHLPLEAPNGVAALLCSWVEEAA